MKANTIKNPLYITSQILFAIDGLGAIISAFLLGIVLVRFESVFGIPAQTLYILATIPILFFLFDLFCFSYNGNNPASKLKLIAIANLTYCILSASMIAYHFDKIKLMGWLYIVIEILIVFVLAMFELRISKKSIILNTKK